MLFRSFLGQIPRHGSPQMCKNSEQLLGILNILNFQIALTFGNASINLSLQIPDVLTSCIFLNQGLNMKFKKSLFISSLIAASIPSYVFACASCGCILSTDWDAQGISGAPGIRFDLRYDYLNQNQYRSGSNKTSKSAVDAQGNEVEDKTINHYVTAGIDYSPSRDWGVNVQIPYIDRSHGTFGDGSGTGIVDTTQLNTSHTKSIGDIKVIGRYLISGYNLGLQLGVKLPTGDYQKNFDSGQPLDRGLQPGSGTTDLLDRKSTRLNSSH